MKLFFLLRGQRDLGSHCEVSAQAHGAQPEKLPGDARNSCCAARLCPTAFLKGRECFMYATAVPLPPLKRLHKAENLFPIYFSCCR